MICDNYNRLNNCKKNYRAYLTKKAASIMHCENEQETKNENRPKTKVEKRILKHHKFSSFNLEDNSELNCTAPLISNESNCKPLIHSNSNNNLLKVKTNKNSCLIEDSPFYIHKVCYNF
jgi:hypothetical protein